MTQNISKNIMEFALCWPSTAGPGASLRVVCKLSQAPCRKLSFLQEWLTEIALGLEMGTCVHFLSQHWDLIPMHATTLSEFLCAPAFLSLEGTTSPLPSAKCQTFQQHASLTSYLLFIIHTSFAYITPCSRAVLLSLPDAVIL